MKYCLIIDNDDQTDDMIQLESESKRNGFPVKCYYFKPDKIECTREQIVNGQVTRVIDEELLLNQLDYECVGKPINLIACDYNLSDPFFDGFRILQTLKNNWRGGKVPTLLYSSDFEKIKEKLKVEIDNIREDSQKLLLFLESYRMHYPDHVVKREEYKTDVINFLKKYKTSLSGKLSEKLAEHPEKEFENIFPRFEGRRLGELSSLVQKTSDETDDFENEFLDRSVDHFIHLKG